MKITKMHGIGNDYLYFFEEPPADVASLAVLLSKRSTSLGSDGLIYICRSDIADYRMRIFNADGSEAKMCGNGIRCVGRYLYDRGITRKTKLSIETASGIRSLQLHIEDDMAKQVSVNMGKAEIGDEIILEACGALLKAIPVSTGNPHAVIFTGEEGLEGPEKYGRYIEHHPLFPGGVNAEFVQILSHNRLRMRVWERGSGVTQACGTGACASAAAAIALGLCNGDETVTVVLDGGELEFRMNKDGTMSMKGPAEFAWEGEIRSVGGRTI